MDNLKRAIIAEIKHFTTDSLPESKIINDLNTQDCDSSQFTLGAFAKPQYLERVERLVKCYYDLYPFRDVKRPCTIATPKLPSVMYDETEGLIEKHMRNGDY